MESLKSTIQKNLNQYQIPDIGWDFDNWLNINQITNVTEDVIDAYMKMTWEDHSTRHSNNRSTPDQVLEMLQSSQIDFLIRQIQNEFGDLYNEEIKLEGKRQHSNVPGSYLSIPKELYTNKRAFKEFCDFLRKFQWYFSNWEENNGSKSIIYIEPKYSDVVTDYVISMCNGYIYKLVPKRLTDKILQSGIRTKGEDTKPNKISNNKPIYRNFPNRSFFFVIPDGEDLQDAVIETAKMFNKYITLDRIREDYDLLQVDLGKASYLQLYKDPAGTDNSVYTYSYIPPKFINKLSF